MDCWQTFGFMSPCSNLMKFLSPFLMLKYFLFWQNVAQKLTMFTVAVLAYLGRCYSKQKHLILLRYRRKSRSIKCFRKDEPGIDNLQTFDFLSPCCVLQTSSLSRWWYRWHRRYKWHINKMKSQNTCDSSSGSTISIFIDVFM